VAPILGGESITRCYALNGTGFLEKNPHLASFTRCLIPTEAPSKIIGTRMDLTVLPTETHDDFESHTTWNCYYFQRIYEQLSCLLEEICSSIFFSNSNL